MSAKGFALPAVLTLLLVFSALSVGLMYVAVTAGSVSTTDLDNTRAYYGAEGAMEHMMADLSMLFSTKQSPSVSDIRGLSSNPPEFQEISFKEYDFSVESVDDKPVAETRHISAGPNEGLMAQIVPMSLNVTADGPAGGEVRMSRDIEVALIPVFQFGMFSDKDLSYHPGPNFDFGGRVHANGNLFLATGASSGLTFRSKVSAAGEIIRAVMINGEPVDDRDGPIWIPTAPGGCDGSRPACRDLQESEGSKVGGPDSADNPVWYNLSTSVYNGMVLSSNTGAKELELPFVADGVGSIEIIRWPQAGEDPKSAVGVSRLFNQAQIRILLSDAAEDLPGSAIRLSNVEPYYDGRYGDTNTAFAEGKESADPDFVRPPGVPEGESWSLIDGYINVSISDGTGMFTDVTKEWLDLGIARENPDAILRFQALKDNDGDGEPDYRNTESNRRKPLRFLPLNLYDPREGEVRDISLGSGDTTGAVGGIFNIVELNVGNLRRWLEGAIGETGGLVDYTQNNGYLLYYSDRRGMVVKDGTYGFEDVINIPDPSGAPDGMLDMAEDVNGSAQLEVHGADNIGNGFGVPNGDPTIRVDLMTVGRKNRVSGARRALKLVNGGLGQLPTVAGGEGGFTVASEVPVYVQGDYNADASGFSSSGHAHAAIIADAVTLLSNHWADWQSFRHPTYVGSSTERRASDTYYRMAVAAGNQNAFKRPDWGNEEYGLDGGTHNFLRYIERWSGRTLYYRGSLVNLYTSQYAVGIYKCCKSVYTPPTRNYKFDTDFLEPEKLPPATPMFKDIVNLGFRQIFTEDLPEGYQY